MSKGRDTKNWQETVVFIITKSLTVNPCFIFLREDKLPISIVKFTTALELEGGTQYGGTHFITE